MAEKEKKSEEPTEGAEGAAEGAEGATPEEGKGKSKKKLFIIIGIVAFLVIGGGAGAFFAGAFSSPPPEGEHAADGAAHGEDGEHAGAGEAEDPAKPPTYYNVPDMIVNLQAERGRPVFLKISMSLELKDELDVPAVERVLPRVIDNFQVYLRELRVDELRGSAGMYRLREELLIRVNQAVAPVKVKDVLFREMLVQ